MSEILDDLMEEGIREYNLCSACRFCIGYCPVWDALDRIFFGFKKESVDHRDIEYFAYLCHDCRNCYYACPYRQPHELNINIPKLNSMLREKVNNSYVWPGFMRGMLKRQYMYMTSSIMAFLALAFVLTAIVGDLSALMLPIHSIYHVMPSIYIEMIGSVLGVWGMTLLIYEGARYWKSINGNYKGIFNGRLHLYALRDTFMHLWFRANGEGCDYPGEYGSFSRFYLHLLMFTGMLVDLVATITALYAQNILGYYPPYSLFSFPVMLGIMGGALILVGVVGLLVLKESANSKLIESAWIETDRAMLYLLLAIVVSGFVITSMRSMPFARLMFLVHISLVATLFVSAPYSKLVHIIYRYLAVVKYYYDKRILSAV
jgi:citrate/tricarballylate utilization protein